MITFEIVSRGEIIIEDEEGETVLITYDIDYPSVAQQFGWDMCEVFMDSELERCDHSGTDGSIDCPECGITASEFIEAAWNWLVDNNGATAEDPGYFETRGY